VLLLRQALSPKGFCAGASQFEANSRASVGYSTNHLFLKNVCVSTLSDWHSSRSRGGINLDSFRTGKRHQESSSTGGGTCKCGMGRPVNKRLVGFASHRAHRVDQATRALSVAMPVSAYIRR
jgi:hypothetical protein